jgi:iron complex outermembrane receptor protein
MRRSVNLILNTTALAAILTLPAYAQVTPSQVAAADAARDIESVIVFGKGQTRQVQALKAVDIEKASPGSSPLLVLNKLPGVNFQSADSFGAYEWSTRITLRGFNQNQLGFTLDGVPLGDMSYGNSNGLHISRAVISENIARSALSQGSGALETASTNNLGGTIQFFSVDPSDDFGGTIAQGVGSNATRRTYVKLDTGLLPTRTKAYASFVDQLSEKWHGDGERRAQQVDMKIQQQIGAESSAKLFLHHSDREEIDDQDASYETFSKLGWNWDNYYPNWKAAIDAANGIFTRGENKILNDNSSPLDAAYYAGSGLRTDMIIGASLDARLTDNLVATTTAYNHRNEGAGLWYTPYTKSPNGVPVSTRTTEYNINRSGVVANLTADIGMHKVEGGIWYENNVFKQARRFYQNELNNPLSPYDIPKNPFFTQWYYKFTTDTVVFHLQDTVTLTDSLTANIGFKSPHVTTKIQTLAGGPVKNGSAKSEKDFLPQVGLTYAYNANNEFYANFTQNQRAFQATNGGLFGASSQAVFDANKLILSPEESDTFEAGWRGRTGWLEAQVSGYHVEFRNRLLGIAQGVGILGLQGVTANVGKVITDGAEIGGTIRLNDNIGWLNSVSYNDSTYDDNYLNRGVEVKIKGKQVVDAPKLLTKSELTYDDGKLFGQVALNYFAKRYVTYSNDVRAGAYGIVNAGIGYRLTTTALPRVKEVVFQLNVNNLLDRKYVSTIGSNGFILSDPLQTQATLLPGAPRSVFLNVTARF